MKQLFVVLLFSSFIFNALPQSAVEFVPPKIQRSEPLEVYEEEPCYSYWEIKDMETGFSYFEYIFEPGDYSARIIVEEEKHDGSKTKEELLREKANGESYYTKYLQYIEGVSTRKGNKIDFKSSDGSTIETFIIFYGNDGKIEKLKNEDTGAFWLKGKDCHKVSISI